jgi:hypothetical protein
VRIIYPYDVVVRNCILFSYLPANFDRGVHASSFPDAANSLFLYNNDVADYRLNGVYVEDGAAANAGALILLRNNVVVNHPAAPAGSEPRGFRSDVDEATVVKSHNVVFATDEAHVEVAGVAGAKSLSGIDNPAVTQYFRLPRPDVDASFVTRTWVVLPAWDPNPDFFRMIDDGVLHDADSDRGQDVGAGSPHLRDIAVRDDIERQTRPGGSVPHTDRGADQVEPGLALAVGPRSDGGTLLWAMPRRNPGTRFELDFRAGAAGRLDLELFDTAGRRLHRGERPVQSGETGALRWANPMAPGVVHYRLRLIPLHGAPSERTGKAMVLQ